MNNQTDAQLLRAYAEHRSEAAFAELVRRHVDFVYSAALRMVCDSHLAQDVTQSVFLALAINAGQLTDRPVLSGWLHRTAQNIAAQTVRTDVRRRAREQEAAAMNQLLSAEPDAKWENIAPHLDAALGELSEPDRDALLLRYFEHKSAGEMAEFLCISDEAAQKRVSRAVERLREFFAKRGVTVGAGGLVVVISANAIQAAPVGLAATISSAAAALAGTVTAATVAAQTTMNWININSVTAIVVAVLATGTGMHVVQQHEANRLRDENQNLVAAQETLSNERNAALSAVSGKNDEFERLLMDKSDLLRLRSEVGSLRRQSNEFETLRKENVQLRELSRLNAANTQATNKLAVVSKIVVTRVPQTQVISEEQIRASIQVKVGEAYDRAAIDRDVQSLYGSGLFYRILVHENKTAEGVILNYALQEKPKLTQIQFTGDTKYGSAALITNLASKVGERLDEQVLARDVQSIQKLYQRSGFPATQVRYSMRVNEDVGEGNVTFEIIE